MKSIEEHKLPPEILEHVLWQAFVLRKQGYRWAHIAPIYEVHVGLVFIWIRRNQADRVDAVLKGGQRGYLHGSGLTLNRVQEEPMRLKIIASNPAERQLVFALWSGCSVMQLLSGRPLGASQNSPQPPLGNVPLS